MPFTAVSRPMALSGCYDSSAALWDLRSGERAVTLRGHTDGLSRAVFSDPLFRRLVSSSWDRTVKVWDLRRGTELFTFRGHTGPVHGCTVHGELAASVGRDGCLRTWLLPP
eukprot:RCo034635